MKCPENGESHANFGENNPKSCFYSPRFGVVGHSHCVVGRLLSVRWSAPVTFGYSPLVVPSSVGGRGGHVVQWEGRCTDTHNGQSVPGVPKRWR